MFDQIYSMLTSGDTKHFDPVSLRPAIKPYTIYIDGISKVFAATGVRVGWSMGPAHVIAKMRALLTHMGAWSPMPEQKATAEFLMNDKAIDSYVHSFKKELEERLWRIHDGFIALKNKGFAVDSISPQAAIYLTINLNLKGKKVGDPVLENQSDVTDYILSEAKLAVVPFYAFGADKQSPWYRLSVGTCKKEEINEMLSKLETALQKLS